jgi:hypothetical protein
MSSSVEICAYATAFHLQLAEKSMWADWARCHRRQRDGFPSRASWYYWLRLGKRLELGRGLHQGSDCCWWSNVTSRIRRQGVLQPPRYQLQKLETLGHRPVLSVKCNVQHSQRRHCSTTLIEKILRTVHATARSRSESLNPCKLKPWCPMSSNLRSCSQS